MPRGIVSHPLHLSPPSWIEVHGFKSLAEPTRLDVRPLTLLAGQNSSGKSSFFQPLLLLKQTLDASFEADPLVLDGPHVRFTSLDQLLSRGPRQPKGADAFSVAFGGLLVVVLAEDQPRAVRRPADLRFTFRRTRNNEQNLAAAIDVAPAGESSVPVDDAHRDALRSLWPPLALGPNLHIFRRGLQADWGWEIEDGGMVSLASFSPVETALTWVRALLHLPGHRGHRERRYPKTAAFVPDRERTTVNGPFTPYTASFLYAWQRAKDREPGAKRALETVVGWLGPEFLGMTRRVVARAPNATEIELRVGRTPRSGVRDLVDLADVGFGVSQVLPVLVALAAAQPGQLVIVEQPELHLHPRAQVAMGHILAATAARGVVVMAETHSILVLRAIQACIARGILAPQAVGLHWFARGKDGSSKVTTAQIEADGSFGDWPVDFADVHTQAAMDYVESAFARLGAADE